MIRRYIVRTDDRLRVRGRWLHAKGTDMQIHLYWTTWVTLVPVFLAALALARLGGASWMNAAIVSGLLAAAAAQWVSAQLSSDCGLIGLLQIMRSEALTWGEARVAAVDRRQAEATTTIDIRARRATVR